MSHEHDWPEVTPVVHSIPFDDETDHVYRGSVCTICGAINGWWEERKNETR